MSPLTQGLNYRSACDKKPLCSTAWTNCKKISVWCKKSEELFHHSGVLSEFLDPEMVASATNVLLVLNLVVVRFLKIL